MARKKQCQNIDELIQAFNLIIKSRCSLSDEDVRILKPAVTQLEGLRKKKGKTNKEVLETVTSALVRLTEFLQTPS